MKTSTRFNNAIQKLYNAFHSNTLHPEDCKQCAVGNILNNQDFWKYISDDHGSLKLNYIGMVNQKLGKKFNGYSPLEILQIEQAFLKGCGYALPLHHKNPKPNNPTDPDNLFKGLSSVIEILCKLDDIPNVMDCSKLFSYPETHKKTVFN
ncbi:Na(+)-translocating NADH-quinone reductase subunit F [Hanstruepera marina]|uniref:Na(+)-translocating NADH-quinone reductase subunit F n=1 Tax=Hanstruepera marina TaxID=2873265 RepID=UPI001CA777F4|nr:Na(+)-translocating NADH-quinone reductase subunit F [Hanstruepera marina]